MNKKETLEKVISLAMKPNHLDTEKEAAKAYRQAAQALEKTKTAIGELMVQHDNH